MLISLGVSVSLFGRDSGRGSVEVRAERKSTDWRIVLPVIPKVKSEAGPEPARKLVRDGSPREGEVWGPY